MAIGRWQRMATALVLGVVVSALMVVWFPTLASAGGLDDPGGPGMMGGGVPTSSVPVAEATALSTTGTALGVPWVTWLLFLAGWRAIWRR